MWYLVFPTLQLRHWSVLLKDEIFPFLVSSFQFWAVPVPIALRNIVGKSNTKNIFVAWIWASHDIWFDQILKKIWKSQYLCHFWTFGLIWYHKCHFQTIWYNFVITNIIFNIFGKYLYLVLSLHWYLMQFKRFFGAKFIKNRENLCYLLIFM